MSNSELAKADADARLLVEAFALSQSDPSIWEDYMTGWKNDLKRRISEKWANPIPASPEPNSGGSPSVGS